LGIAYFNVHTVNFGGGEIRGNIVLVPEPSTFVLLAATALPLAMYRRQPAIA
jgi:hypothetical protein